MMAHSEKQKLQKARAWLKFRLTGMKIRYNEHYITSSESALIEEINSAIDTLIRHHDNESRTLGLNVPEHRCKYCSREAIKTYEGIWICNKHIKEFNEER